MPARDEKFELYICMVRRPSFQSDSYAVSAVPIINSVLVRAMMPVIMINMMSMKTKMTPIEPTFMKMLKSFLLQRIASITNRAIAG